MKFKVVRGRLTSCAPEDGDRSFTVPDYVTSIGAYVFNKSCGLESVVIPDSVTYVDDSAFQKLDGISIHISNINVLPSKLRPLAVRGYLENYAEGIRENNATKDFVDYFFKYRKYWRDIFINDNNNFFPVYFYIMDNDLIFPEEIDGLIANTDNLEIKAALLEYKRTKLNRLYDCDPFDYGVLADADDERKN